MDIEIIQKFSKECDPQLIILLIDFKLENETDEINNYLELKYNLLQLTERNDEKAKLAQILNKSEDTVNKHLKRTQETKRLYGSLYDELSEFISIFTEETSEENSQQQRDVDLWTYLKSNYELDDSIIQKTYHLAQFSYKCGMLNTSNSCLEMCKALIPQSSQLYINCLWGKVAVDILNGNYKIAVADLRRLSEHIDKMALADHDSSMILKHRSWLIHWSLFVYFRLENGLEHLMNLCLSDKVYMSTLQLVCPYLMRYITTAALIMSDRKRNTLDDVLRLFEEEPSELFDDPISILIKSICIDFDFTTASELLSQAEETLAKDYFMNPFVNEFMRCARSLVFENFCRIHHCIGVGPVSEQLDLSWDETEAYILELVKNNRLNARIDSDKGNIVMEFNTSSPYETMLNKFRLLQIKFDAFTSNYERRHRIHV